MKRQLEEQEPVSTYNEWEFKYKELERNYRNLESNLQYYREEYERASREKSNTVDEDSIRRELMIQIQQQLEINIRRELEITIKQELSIIYQQELEEWKKNLEEA